LIKIPEGVDFKDIPLEEKYKSATTGLLQRVHTIYKGLYKKFGQPGLDLIREVSETYGKEIAERGKKRVKPDDVKSAGLFLIRVFDMINCEGEVIEFSDDKVVIRLFKCPYPFDDPKICEAHTTMEKALIESLSGEFSYKITESIPSGGRFCEHVISLKKS
jgi:predicted ArsR family transcriptional regulator